MKKFFHLSVTAFGLTWLLVIGGPGSTCAGAGSYDETLPVLQIGAFTYTNVTVTTKAKDYIFILHSGGMANIKVKELPEDVMTLLGYEIPDTRPKTEKAAEWAKKTLAQVETPQVKEIEKKVQEKIGFTMPSQAQLREMVDVKYLAAILAGLLIIHIFFSLCFSQICEKAGRPGGALVWLPVLQLIPLLRAANMSGWWFLAYFIPVVNVIVQIVWSFKIAQARGKNAFVGFLLLLPVTNLLALLYLAFSGSSRKEVKVPSRKIELMTLETA